MRAERRIISYSTEMHRRDQSNKYDLGCNAGEHVDDYWIRPLGCVSQDVEPPESAAMSRKGTKVLGPLRRVRQTRAALRQANIRENKGPSLNKIQVKHPHQRSPYAVKFEDQSHEETERQERCAAETRGDLAKNILKVKETDQATFFSPTDEWILPAASTIKLEERKCVVDSRASMHMVSKKDLNPAELETVRVSECPTTVMTANGKVQTREEATVCVKQLDLFVTAMLLEDTPAVLSLGKLCEDHGFYYHRTSGQKPHLNKNGKEDRLQYGELRTIRGPWSIDNLFKLIFTYFSNIFIGRNRNSHGVSSINKKWDYE